MFQLGSFRKGRVCFGHWKIYAELKLLNCCCYLIFCCCCYTLNLFADLLLCLISRLHICAVESFTDQSINMLKQLPPSNIENKVTSIIKSTFAIVTPLLLLCLMYFQVYKVENVNKLRNPYLLENLSYQSNWIWDALSKNTNKLHSEASVVEKKNPNDWLYKTVLFSVNPYMTVHIFWCTQDYFEVKHYISVMSTVQKLQPDKITIHYLFRPRSDPTGYFSWLENLQQNIAMLSLEPINDSKYCTQKLPKVVDSKSKDIKDPYGVFLTPDVILSNLTRDIVLELLATSLTKEGKTHGNDSLSKELRTSQLFLTPENKPSDIASSPGKFILSCPVIDGENSKSLQSLERPRCLSIASYISEDELFKKNASLFQFFRKLLYKHPKPVEARNRPNILIPSILHVILNRESTNLNAFEMFAIQTAYMAANFESVVIHSPKLIKGEHYKIVCVNIKICPKIVVMPLFDSESKLMTYALHTLLHHGGFVHFGNILFNTVIPYETRTAEAVAIQRFQPHQNRHRTIDTSFLGCVPGSPFIQSVLFLIHESVQFGRSGSLADMITHAYHVKPDSVYLDPKLLNFHVCNTSVCTVAPGNSALKSYASKLIWKSVVPRHIYEMSRVYGTISQVISI